MVTQGNRWPSEGEDPGESPGEHLLGSLLEGAHVVPPEGVAAFVAEQASIIGASDVAVYLQDYEQQLLMPLTSAGLPEREPEPVDTSVAGRAFTTSAPLETDAGDGTGRRLWLPLLDGTDRVGVMGLTLAEVGERERLWCVRMAALVSEIVVTKANYGDVFFLTRRRREMTLASEMQWQLLPPLTIVTPQVVVAGVVEPAYEAGGDAFDYAVNEGVVHLAIVDAMGHGLGAAVMATVAVGAYRHSRRQGTKLGDKYRRMDAAVAEQFGEERFVTAQMAELDLETGRLLLVNAGHPAPLLVRGHHVVRRLLAPTTLPVGWGGSDPELSEEDLEPGDRVVFFTDGVVEERSAAGEQFGEDRLIELLEREMTSGRPAIEALRRLSRSLLEARDGQTTDDATILLVEWRGSDA